MILNGFLVRKIVFSRMSHRISHYELYKHDISGG